MRPVFFFGVAAAWAVFAAAARPAPTLEIRAAAARVLVIPEARRDIAVSLTHADPKLPIRIHRLLDHVYVSGDLPRGAVRGCRGMLGAKVVAIQDRGGFAYDRLPALIVRTPMAVRLSAGEAVFGEIERSDSVDFTNKGCGDWVIGDVRGRLRVNQAGAGDARAGSAGAAVLTVAGSGGITAKDIRAGLVAVSSGSGDISAASLDGPLDARVAGPGDIVVSSGSVTGMTASIAGSGAVTFKGVAASLSASIAGKGDVTVGKVTGPVYRHVFGSGAVRVGR